MVIISFQRLYLVNMAEDQFQDDGLFAQSRLCIVCSGQLNADAAEQVSNCKPLNLSLCNAKSHSYSSHRMYETMAAR